MSLATPFETTRMRFRLLAAWDLDVVYRQFSDPDMCRYFSEPPVTLQEAREIIDFFQHPDEDGYLRYGMFAKESCAFIGTCGFHHWDREALQVEIGYDIWKDFWRQGYATEAIAPLLEICFLRLKVQKVYVLIDRNNVSSIRTASKAGFRESVPCRPLDEPSQVCMVLTRAGWESACARSTVKGRDGETQDGI